MRAGTPRPDISTVNAFKQTLPGAKSIGTQSTSAIYLKTRVFPQLGIAGPLVDKLSDAGAAEVASGRVEMVVLPVSEILPVRGVEAAKRLIDFLAPEKATPAVEKMGMQRLGLGEPK